MNNKSHKPYKHKWMKNAVLAESRRFTNWRDFRLHSHTAYRHALQYADEITWLEHLKLPSCYWTRERVFECSRAYATRSAFRLHEPSAFQLAMEAGWLDAMTWLDYLPTDRRYWSYERAKAESRKYAGLGRKAFQRGAPVAYFAAKANGWLDRFPWLARPNPYTTPMHTVYKYVFPRQHAVYIGLTIDPIGRDNHHRHGHKGKRSAVFRFACAHGEQVPRMLIIAEHLTISEAQACEDVLVKANRERGWLVLNKGATGVGCGSVGSVANKWTRSRVFKLSHEFMRPKQFAKAYPSAYEKARRLGWLHAMVWLYAKGDC